MLTPRPYQLVGRDFLAARRHALLADEMRVGKTPQAILAAAKVGAETSLVVCPAIAVDQWRGEWRRWWPEGRMASVMSYDKARMNLDALVAQLYDVVIVDEAHFAKNPEAQRTKMVYGKGGLGHCSKHLWALSGTPAPKHAGELWPMLRAFGVVGMSYFDFTRRYCRIDYLSQRPIGTKEDKIPELKALLAKVMLRRTRKEVAPDMPEIGFDFLDIAPGKADLNAPTGLSDSALVEWLERNAVGDKDDRIAVALAKIGPLGDEIEFSIANDLYKQTVVFGWHVEPLQKLVSTLRARGLTAELITGATTQTERTRIQIDFREGRIQVVAANIMAAGTAIDLSAASHGYFLELWWVGGDNLQAANRLVSMDKAEPVTFDVCTWPGSVDCRVQGVLVQRMRELRALI